MSTMWISGTGKLGLLSYETFEMRTMSMERNKNRNEKRGYTSMNYEEKYIENVLEGETQEEYITFVMPIEDYVEYDDPDLYV